MDFAEGPAVLGSIIMFAALAAWTLGRWQGGLVSPAGQAAASPPAEVHRDEAPALPASTLPASTSSHSGPREERSAALAAVPSLGELHAEITAYRNAEQVLSRLDETMLRLDPLPAGNAACRFIGLTGEPTCGATGGVLTSCAEGVPCVNAIPPRTAWRGDQPSPAAPGFSRV